MKTIFLADAHLKGPGEPEQDKIARLFDTIRGRGGDLGAHLHGDPLIIDRLVIAGDFFDFWFSRGTRVYPGFQPIIDRIAVLKEEGVKITFCEGNHDFSLEPYFAGRLGIEVYPEWMEMAIDGHRILISHGDTVDQSNRRYLALRCFLRSALARGLQRCLPLSLLWGIARFSSKMSKGMTDASHDRIAEIMHRFALAKFQEGYDGVVLGHCHKPLLIEERFGGKKAIFATLGDWTTHDTYLLYDNSLFSLVRFPVGSG